MSGEKPKLQTGTLSYGIPFIGLGAGFGRIDDPTSGENAWFYSIHAPYGDHLSVLEENGLTRSHINPALADNLTKALSDWIRSPADHKTFNKIGGQIIDKAKYFGGGGVAGDIGWYPGNIEDASGVDIIVGGQAFLGLTLSVPANYEGPVDLPGILSVPGVELSVSGGPKINFGQTIALTWVQGVPFEPKETPSSVIRGLPDTSVRNAGSGDWEVSFGGAEPDTLDWREMQTLADRVTSAQANGFSDRQIAAGILEGYDLNGPETVIDFTPLPTPSYDSGSTYGDSDAGARGAGG